MNTNIKTITACEILDSRSNPTLETEVILDCGLKAKASVPSGASTGTHEAKELRDNNKKRYNGFGVLKACENVNKKISHYLKGEDVSDQGKIDNLMVKLDGTKNKSNLGANAMLSVSLAVARAGALAKNIELYQYLAKKIELVPALSADRRRSDNWSLKSEGGRTLPIPMFNIFNGGAHADSNVDIQEFMIIPLGVKKYSEQLRAGSEIFQALGQVMKKNNLSTNVGNEGGYAADLKSTTQVFDLIVSAIKLAGYKAGKEIFLGIDAGASEFYDKKTKKYNLKLEHKKLTAEQLCNLYLSWLEKYPIISFEDPLAEDDFTGWATFHSLSPYERSPVGRLITHYSSLLLIGDDLFTTNIDRLQIGIEKNLANAVIVKPNQIGTLTETVNFVKEAQKNNYKIIVSHRSGETNDDFVADLAVAVNADFVKFGAPNRGERVAKYNRLLEIDNNF